MTLHKGDRLTGLYPGKPEEQAQDLHIIRLDPKGHYAGRPTLLFAYFKDLKTQSLVT